MESLKSNIFIYFSIHQVVNDIIFNFDNNVKQLDNFTE
jgi:hypothetical protein